LNLLADILFKQSSFKAFADAYNFQNSRASLHRGLMNPKRLSDIFYCFEIIKFYNENNIPGPIKCKFYKKKLNSKNLNFLNDYI